jgi:hypothetical protein
MRRRALVWFAVLGALLIVTAQPAAASQHLAVGSQNSTATEFNSAQTLQNVTVQGSGTDADAVLSGGSVDDFESGIGSYTAFGGETADWGTSTSQSQSGSTSAEFALDSTDTYNLLSSGTVSNDKIVMEGWVRFGNTARAGFGITDNPGSDGITFRAQPGSNTILIYERSASSAIDSTSQTINTGTWYYIKVIYDAQSVEMYFDDDTSPQQSPLAQANGTTQNSFNGFQYGLFTQDVSAGDSGSVYWDDFAEVEAANRGVYVSSNHTVEQADAAAVNVTLDNATATVTVAESASGDILNQTTLSTTANHTLTLSGQDENKLQTNVTFQAQSGTTTAKLHDESILFEPSAPALSDAEPISEIENYDSDGDFPTAQGDSVTVTASNSTSTIGSQTITSNGTVTLSYAAAAGSNNITWTAADDYGTDASASASFSTPATLEVRNESAPSSLVTTNSEITVTFFADDGNTIVERTSNDGRFDMSGLPADKTYVIEVDADGYRSRNVIITSLFDQQTVYLLPNSAPAAQVEFKLNDDTGRFDSSNSRLFVDIPLNVSGSTAYKTAFADRFGASQSLRVTLRDNTRYRLRVVNDDGDERVLGSYTVAGSDVVTLDIGQLQFAVDTGQSTYDISSSTLTNQNGTVTDVRFAYRDPAQQTSRIDISVQTLNGSIIGNDSGTNGPYGNYSFTQPVSNATAQNHTFVVAYEIVRNGETIRGQTRPGLNRYRPGIPLAPGLKHIFSVGLLLVVGGLFSAQNARVGAVITPLFAGAMWYVDWLPPETSVLAIALALGVGIVANYGRR